MALDRIRPVKFEDPSTGGTQTDAVPTDANPNEDYPDVRGVVFQDDTSNDETVYATRTGDGKMKMFDQDNPTGATVTQMLAGGTDMNDLITSRNNGQVMVSRNAGNVLVHR